MQKILTNIISALTLFSKLMIIDGFVPYDFNHLNKSLFTFQIDYTHHKEHVCHLAKSTRHLNVQLTNSV